MILIDPKKKIVTITQPTQWFLSYYFEQIFFTEIKNQSYDCEGYNAVLLNVFFRAIDVL